MLISIVSARVQDRIFCEIVAQLVISDAVVTDEEQSFLERLMEQLELDIDERRAVLGAVDIGQPIDDRLAQLDQATRLELLAVLKEAAAVDGAIGRGEQEIIDQVRAALDP